MRSTAILVLVFSILHFSHQTPLHPSIGENHGDFAGQEEPPKEIPQPRRFGSGGNHRPDRLLPNEIMYEKDCLKTANDVTACLNVGGNFVVYQPGMGIKWQSGTGAGGTAPFYLVMGLDNNLALFDESSSTALFNSGTATKGSGHATLVMAEDGNLVIMDPKNAVLWSSGAPPPPPPPPPVTEAPPPPPPPPPGGL